MFARTAAWVLGYDEDKGIRWAVDGSYYGTGIALAAYLDRQFLGGGFLMRRLTWLFSLFMTLAGVATIVVLSELHSWSSAATTWALTAALAAPTVADIAVVRLRGRSARRHGDSGGTTRPAA
jgi:hypothetical protein